MKKSVLLLLIIIILLSCKSIPEPKNESDSLVIGSVIWDYPDGFFHEKPKTFKDSFTIIFVNLTTSEEIRVRSSNGYFYFICNGNDKFILEQITYVEPNPTIDWSISYNLNLKIDSKPQKIIYLGHINIIFASPEFAEAKTEEGLTKTYWRFRKSYIIENKTEDLNEFITKHNGSNHWSNCEIFNLYEN